MCGNKSTVSFHILFCSIVFLAVYFVLSEEKFFLYFVPVPCGCVVLYNGVDSKLIFMISFFMENYI